MTQPPLPEEPVVEEIDNTDLDTFIAESGTESDAATDEALARLNPDGEETDTDGGTDTSEAPTEEAPASTETSADEVTSSEPGTASERASLQQEIDQLKVERQTREKQIEDAQIHAATEAEVVRLAQELEQKEGYDPESAQRVARAETSARVAEYRAQSVIKRSLALELSQASGLPLEILMQYDDEASMRTTATTLGPIYKANQLFQKRMTSEEKAVIPPQEFDRPAASRAGPVNEDQLLDRYNAGDRSAPAVEAARRATYGT